MSVGRYSFHGLSADSHIDLCGALISDGTQSTLLRPSKWLAPDCHEDDAAQLFQAAHSPDMHANYAVYLCAKACELVSDRTQFVELGVQNDCTGDKFHRRWIRLWEDLQQWIENRPQELLPVQTTQSKPFPHILFLHWAAISSNQLYHTACILLLNTMPKSVKLRPAQNVSLAASRSRTLTMVFEQCDLAALDRRTAFQPCL